jgi:uncharacterized protein
MSTTIARAYLPLLFFLSLLQGAAHPQPTNAAGPSEIENTSRYMLKSAYTGTTYVIDVLRVASVLTPPASGLLLPVIYVLDGNTLFPMVSQMAAVSIPFSRSTPAVLVVSIGYAADTATSYAENISKRTAWRTRDYLPPVTSGRIPGGMETAGGAAMFLAFIEKELKPFLAARYAVDAEEQTLAGDSAGGLFTIYALLNSPASFQRYLAISPSLFWDEHRLIEQAAGFALDVTPPKKLAIIVGELETKERMGQDMIGDAQALVEALQGQKGKGLEVSSYLFPDEDHISVVPGALRRGLRTVGALP